MIHRSPFPDVDIPAVPLTAYVLEHAGVRGDKPALIDGPSGRTLTYAQLADAVHRTAGGLAAAGVRPGDVVALVAPNVPEYAVVFHGTAVAGGVITTINPTYTEREIAHQLTDSGAVLVVVAAPFLATVRAALGGTGVRAVYLLGEPPDGELPDGVRPFGELLAADPIDQVDVDPERVVALPYSSGTTGGAKGVMLSHRNLVANIAQCITVSTIGPDDVSISVLPFFHIYGMQVLMNMGLRTGGTVVTLPRFDLGQFLEAHQTYSATQTFVAPPIVVALAKHPLVDQYDLSALQKITSGAAPLSGSLAIETGERLKCEVVQGYGMTEMSPVSHMTPNGQFRAGSVGVAAPNTEVRIVDPASAEDADEGADGEVWIRGPQVMIGYLNNPRATELTLDADGWLHTGDIGHIDDAGHLYVVDRLKELIKVKGFQVPPAELEALLLAHPKVADAAVIGRPDDESGEVPIAFVVPRPGADVDEAELRDDIAAQVATYKRLHSITFVEAIPKSAAGKILRRVLKEQAASN
jgi:4-coumarate--CoA ligase